MILGKVVGTIVTTISHKDYKNRRLLVVQPLILEGDQPDPNEDFIALDNTQAGIGDTVLVNREGNGARQALKNQTPPSFLLLSELWIQSIWKIEKPPM